MRTKPDKAFWILIGYTVLIMIWLFGGKVECAPFETTIAATNNGRIRTASQATYVSARDTTAGAAASDYITVGQNLPGANLYAVFRSFFTFSIPDMWYATACTLYLDGHNDTSTTDFGIYIVSAPNYGTLDNGDFDQFDGFRAGNTHTGTILNATWNSSTYSADWNKIVFNAAGLDSIKAHTRGSLLLAIISKEDYDNSAPTNAEYCDFVNATAYLSLRYEADSTPDRRLLQETYLWKNGDNTMLWRP